MEAAWRGGLTRADGDRTDLDKIVTAIPDRYKAMVQLVAWCAPRFGELAARPEP